MTTKCFFSVTKLPPLPQLRLVMHNMNMYYNVNSALIISAAPEFSLEVVAIWVRIQAQI